MRVIAWINAELEKPNDDRNVLVVKQLKSGRREMAIGYWNGAFQAFDPVTKERTVTGCWVVQGCTNVIYWTELPKIPED